MKKLVIGSALICVMAVTATANAWWGRPWGGNPWGPGWGNNWFSGARFDSSIGMGAGGRGWGRRRHFTHPYLGTPYVPGWGFPNAIVPSVPRVPASPASK